MDFVNTLKIVSINKDSKMNFLKLLKINEEGLKNEEYYNQVENNLKKKLIKIMR